MDLYGLLYQLAELIHIVQLSASDIGALMHCFLMYIRTLR